MASVGIWGSCIWTKLILCLEAGSQELLGARAETYTLDPKCPSEVHVLRLGLQLRVTLEDRVSLRMWVLFIRSRFREGTLEGNSGTPVCLFPISFFLSSVCLSPLCSVCFSPVCFSLSLSLCLSSLCLGLPVFPCLLCPSPPSLPHSLR